MSDHSTAKGDTVSAAKDKYLIVAIHQLMEGYGWNGIEENFGVESHNMVYIKSESHLERIEIKAHVMGVFLNVSFLGISPKKGTLDKALDFNTQEIPKKFEISKYVSSDLKILNEQRLRNAIAVVIKQLEMA
ncbi:MAG TPA: hypothetical protein C5S50_05295 [Methanosarcinaceae archaeon]|nr:hypothetical protein [Methanosarcinaceae archaeon]